MKIFMDSKLQICDKSFKRTPQGYLMLQGIISRSGSQQYLDAELGMGNNGQLITLERPVSEVTDALSIASFISMPITDEHPTEGHVNPNNFKKYSKGVVVDAETTPSNQVKAHMIVYDADLILKIEGGKRELSAGYAAELEFSDDGKSAIQRKIRGNHVAFVDAARCGKECSIFDSKPNTGDTLMAEVTIKKVKYEMADSVAPAVVALIDDNSALETKLADSNDAHDKTKAMLDAANEKVKEMEDQEEDEEEKAKKIGDAAHALLAVLNDAAKLVKDYDATGKTVAQIKRDVVLDSKPEFADKSDAYIEARFDMLVDAAAKADPMADGFEHQMNDGAAELSDSDKARQESIKRKQNAWKGDK